MPDSSAPITVKVLYLSDLWREDPPACATERAAGLDLKACIKDPELTIAPGERAAIPAGLAIEICAPGVAGFVFSRSGLGARDGLTVAQGVGVIDPDYRGEIVVWLLNTASEPRTVRRGERVAQLLFLPYYAADLKACDALGDTRRGAGGFGHTGQL